MAEGATQPEPDSSLADTPIADYTGYETLVAAAAVKAAHGDDVVVTCIDYQGDPSGPLSWVAEQNPWPANDLPSPPTCTLTSVDQKGTFGFPDDVIGKLYPIARQNLLNAGAGEVTLGSGSQTGIVASAKLSDTQRPISTPGTKLNRGVHITLTTGTSLPQPNLLRNLIIAGVVIAAVAAAAYLLLR